jgi:predicted DNA-binding protein (UPF0251 family)
MQIYDFTQPELDYFREKCNFTQDERTLFEYRATGLTLEKCAELMNVSIATANRLNKKVKNKIIKVC